MEFSVICVIWELITEQWSCVYRIGENIWYSSTLADSETDLWKPVVYVIKRFKLPQIYEVIN